MIWAAIAVIIIAAVIVILRDDDEDERDAHVINHGGILKDYYSQKRRMEQ